MLKLLYVAIKLAIEIAQIDHFWSQIKKLIWFINQMYKAKNFDNIQKLLLIFKNGLLMEKRDILGESVTLNILMFVQL